MHSKMQLVDNGAAAIKEDGLPSGDNNTDTMIEQETNATNIF